MRMLQEDCLMHTATPRPKKKSYRIAAPIVPAKSFTAVARLHPRVRVARRDYVVVTDKMAAIDIKAIRSVVGTMKPREWDIRRALDLVFVGV